MLALLVHGASAGAVADFFWYKTPAHINVAAYFCTVVLLCLLARWIRSLRKRPKAPKHVITSDAQPNREISPLAPCNFSHWTTGESPHILKWKEECETGCTHTARQTTSVINEAKS
jgi:hypothetical protein